MLVVALFENTTLAPSPIHVYVMPVFFRLFSFHSLGWFSLAAKLLLHLNIFILLFVEFISPRDILH